MEKPTEVIRVENIGKKYFLGSMEPYLTLRDSIANIFSGKFHTQKQDFWALRHINFEVFQGESLGIIGQNGAGKSTLLKILSRITPPTEGKVSIKGRVASLLEVGTGFHPELTGRENIFLNGAILGMKQKEIKAKIDEIISFAEIEKFIDTPVKRYSSGMYVRLAFAIAAHLDPEILIIDEVLAVGDTAFQEKCLKKMDSIIKGEKRTILFVSHNLGAIRKFCNRTIYLAKGSMKFIGETSQAINAYLSDIFKEGKVDLRDRKDRRGSGRIKFSEFRIYSNGKETCAPLVGEKVTFALSFEKKTDEKISNVSFSVGIDNQLGERVLFLSSELTGQVFKELPSKGMIGVTIPKFPLIPGRYSVTLFMSSGGEILDWVLQAALFKVESGDFFGTGKLLGEQSNVLVEHKFFLY